jgi:hypothetical protein
MNMEHSESKIVLWKDSEWSQIDGELCRVTDFGTLGSFVDANGKVHAGTKTMPYGSITLECKRLGTNVTGFVCHKMDFQHLWAAFRERKVQEDEEVLIVWTKKYYKWKLTKFLTPFMPKLWVMICPKEAYDLWIDSSYKPELWGEARWNAMKPIIQWKPEVME